MVWRSFWFFGMQLLGGGAGWWLGHLPGALIGVLLGSWLWLAQDSWSASRLLAWLRSSELANAPAQRGLWGEVGERARRWLRLQSQQTQASDERLNDMLSALQASPNGVVLLDDQSRIEWCNQISYAQFGFDAARDRMQNIGNLVRDPSFSHYLSAQDFSHDLILQGRDSTPGRPVRLSVQIYPYGDGRRLLLARDVTAQEQAEAMRRDFVANVSHEIRTPLTVLTGFVETMQTLPLSADERARYLALMAQQSQRMQTLVSDLLTLSRLEGSPPPAAGDWTPVAALLAHCEQEARALGAALGKQQELRFAAGPAAEVAGAQSELLSALSNLVSNAVRYTGAGGAIDVGWQALADGRAVFSVRDTGPGIAPEHLPRLTERFYRVDRSRSRETGGTGLGLAIVKHVAQRHGAELKIESTPGAGSTFSIVFPAARVRAALRPVPAPGAPLATES
jgi:two-component system phosphate regulon sensor histidine kinase PhoR